MATPNDLVASLDSHFASPSLTGFTALHDVLSSSPSPTPTTNFPPADIEGLLSSLLEERECIAAATSSEAKEQRVHLVSLSSCLPKVEECLRPPEADGLGSVSEVYGWNILNNVAEGGRNGENDGGRANGTGDGGGGSNSEASERIRRLVEERDTLKEEARRAEVKAAKASSERDAALMKARSDLEERDRRISMLKNDKERAEARRRTVEREKEDMERNFLMRMKEQSALLQDAAAQQQQPHYAPPPPPVQRATSHPSHNNNNNNCSPPSNPFQAASNVNESESNNNASKVRVCGERSEATSLHGRLLLCGSPDM